MKKYFTMKIILVTIALLGTLALWSSVWQPSHSASASQYTTAPTDIAPLLSRGALPTGGLLLAAANDRDGMTKDASFFIEYGSWADYIFDVSSITSSPSEGKGTPWLKQDAGVPVLRTGQKTFVAPSSTIEIYDIYTKQDFYDAVYPTKFYLKDEAFTGTLNLMADIDFGNETLIPIKNFRGTLNGNGKSLKNFVISNINGNAALIENMENGALVQQLVIENAQVLNAENENVKDTVAILVAKMESGTTVKNCLIKDCRLEGMYVLGMFAGYNAGIIQKCLVVNGVIRSDALGRTDYSHDLNAVRIGGIVGDTYSGTTSYCYSMLNKFELDYTIDRNATIGRVFGHLNSGNYNNYGWGETGFAIWDVEKGEYYNEYYPNWNISMTVGTGAVYKDNGRNGENLFVGDKNSSAPSGNEKLCINSSTWTLLTDDGWSYFANDHYPKPTGSSVDTKGLVARRGLELDRKGFSNSTTKIGTALGFANMKGKNYSGDKLELCTDILITSLSGDNYDDVYWSIPYPSVGEIGGGCFMPTFTGDFDGNGYEIRGLKFYESVSFAAYNGFFGTFSGNLGNLALIDVFYRLSGTSQAYNTDNVDVGVLVGHLSGDQSSIKNCFVSVTNFQVTSSYYLRIGLLAGRWVESGEVAHNIVRLKSGSGSVEFKSQSSLQGGHIMGGLIGNSLNSGVIDYNFSSLEKSIFFYMTYYSATTIFCDIAFGSAETTNRSYINGTISSDNLTTYPNDDIKVSDFSSFNFNTMGFGTGLWGGVRTGVFPYLRKQLINW